MFDFRRWYLYFVPLIVHFNATSTDMATAVAIKVIMFRRRQRLPGETPWSRFSRCRPRRRSWRRARRRPQQCHPGRGTGKCRGTCSGWAHPTGSPSANNPNRALVNSHLERHLKESNPLITGLFARVWRNNSSVKQRILTETSFLTSHV